MNSTDSRVAAVVVFYLVAALAMVVANKWVLNTTDAPLFFLFLQLLIAVVLFLVCQALRLIRLPFDFSLQTIKGLAPMVGLNVLGLSLNNYTLKYVDASFYQIARGLVLPFTVLTSFVFLSSRPSLFVLVSCFVVTVGFLWGVSFDGTYPSTRGIFYGLSSSMVTALHAVVIKRTLHFSGSALDLSWYQNLLSSILLLPILLILGEGPEIWKLFMTPEIANEDGLSKLGVFLSGSAVTGTIGFLMSIASLLSIKVTSPITHMISSAIRGVLGSLLGVWVFDEVITVGRGISICIILLGSMLYTWVKHREGQAAQQKTEEPPKRANGYESVPMEDLEAGNKQKSSEPS